MIVTDTLRTIRELPADLLADLGTLIVNRQGNGPRAYMVTEDIAGYVVPGATYRLGADSLDRVAEAAAETPPPVQSSSPPHVRVTGQWNTFEDTDSKDANILGGFGALTLTQTALDIPEAPATPEALAFYNARLIGVGDDIVFETDSNLPVTVMRIGEAYTEGYLKVEALGGGAFIEYHDRPHLHMPLDEASSGYLLLGRSEGDEYLFSAFGIPSGHAIYTSPYALHADPYLVGRYLVVYSVTKNYSTVVFRKPDGNLANPRITPAG